MLDAKDDSRAAVLLGPRSREFAQGAFDENDFNENFVEIIFVNCVARSRFICRCPMQGTTGPRHLQVSLERRHSEASLRNGRTGGRAILHGQKPMSIMQMRTTDERDQQVKKKSKSSLNQVPNSF